MGCAFSCGVCGISQAHTLTRVRCKWTAKQPAPRVYLLKSSWKERAIRSGGLSLWEIFQSTYTGALEQVGDVIWHKCPSCMAIPTLYPQHGPPHQSFFSISFFAARSTEFFSPNQTHQNNTMCVFFLLLRCFDCAYLSHRKYTERSSAHTLTCGHIYLSVAKIHT